MTVALSVYQRTRNKYGAVRTEVDGITFDSKREAKRWGDLCLLVKLGRISDLRRQWKFDIHAADGTKVATYRADFIYVENGQDVVEDAKGLRTPLYKLKKKLVEAEHKVRIIEV